MTPDVPPSPPMMPVTTTCVMDASRAYQVPVVILAGVMAQEGGKIGQVKINSNKTSDHGPMQINTVWLSGLKDKGISSSQVANNGCLNVYVGAAILKKHAKDTNGNWLRAIGNYHSKTPLKRDDYLAKVSVKIRQIISGTITLASILSKANSS